MATVRFIVETSALPRLIFARNGDNEIVQLVPASGPKRVGSVEAQPGDECALFCVFSGAPGTKYKVTLEPQAGLEVEGPNPIESAISTQLTFGSARRRFRVLS